MKNFILGSILSLLSIFCISFLLFTSCNRNSKTEICNNSKDDDGDGLVDCRDNDCPPCGDEKEPQPKIEICGNGIDDDNDGLIDCKDNNCPPCTEICNNNIDDDGDGLVDCKDINSCPPCPDNGPTPPPPPKFRYYDINISGLVTILDNEGKFSSDTKCADIPFNNNITIETTANPQDLLSWQYCCGDEVVIRVYFQVTPSKNESAIAVVGSLKLYEGSGCDTEEVEDNEEYNYIVTPGAADRKEFRLTHDCTNCGDWASGNFTVKLTPRQ